MHCTAWRGVYRHVAGDQRIVLDLMEPFDAASPPLIKKRTPSGIIEFVEIADDIAESQVGHAAPPKAALSETVSCEAPLRTSVPDTDLSPTAVLDLPEGGLSPARSPTRRKTAKGDH